MPPSLPAGWTVTKRSNHSGAYPQLDAIGVTLGFPPRGAAALEFSVNGAACSLALSIDSGTVTGLDLSIKAEGPPLASGPLISLRPETAFDRTGKERGIAREVQLGDEGFDAAVYVDSNATDAEVKRVLAAPGVRAAVQSLLRSGAEDLRIDSAGVRAHWKKSSECFLPERVLPVLESLLLVHRAGRPRGKVLATPGEGLQRLLIAMLMAIGGAFFFANSRWDAPVGLLGAGAFLGLVASFFFIAPATRRVSGGSSSHRVARVITILLFLELPLAGALGLLLLNCGLDGSEGKVLEGVVRDASDPYGDEHQQVEVSWEDRSVERFHGESNSWRVGNRAQKTVHQGLLGVAWSWGLERPDARR
jgi:hypothetical protein